MNKHPQSLDTNLAPVAKRSCCGTAVAIGTLEVVSRSEETDPSAPGLVGNAQDVPNAKDVPVAPTSLARPDAPASGASGDPGDSFGSYMKSHDKKYYAKYRTERRRSAYMDNLEEINTHNQEFKAGKNRFRLAPNAFADMPNSEYRKRLVRLKTDTHRKVSETITDEIVGSSQSDEVPDELDWREKGFKTEPANQKTCGSCYAFSVAYAISAQLMKHIGRVELVSEQQMVDCSTETGNLGCGGGSLRNTLKYLEKAGGVMREVDYPYTSSVSVCSYY
ncbi:procathepsin L-like [Anopheles bellator]|uniref:procathepsin L-like n=1 Tax=Anopheles bellator TaxID=139047 RepID=UPI002647ADD3|nr:procathepsin L-like [Anopheles bellator]